MLRRVADWIAHACLAAAWALMLAWCTGMIVNDRLMWSQYLWWMPTPAVVIAGGLLIAVAWSLGLLSMRPGGTADSRAAPRGWRWSVRGTWLMVGVLAAIFGVFEARWYRALLPDRPAADKPLRLVTWNINSTRIDDLPGKVRPLAPDVLCIANRPYFGSFGDLRAAVGEGTSVAAGGRLAVISKHPVIAYAHVPLGITGAQTRTFRWEGGGMVSIDKGEALLVLLDTKEWNGGTVCLWLLDLPSDPPIPRARMMREARTAIDHFAGPAYLPRQAAADEPIMAAEALRAQLLRPDVLTGDLNTPRHSHSLKHLAPEMRAAPDMAGGGWRMSFPAAFPVVAIDNTLVGDTIGCYHYSVHELSARGRDHLAQLTVLVP